MRICLTGKIRSGKDSVANYLVKSHKFHHFKFGEGIGNILRDYFPEEIRDGKNRALWQEVGQGLKRIKKDIWVDYCFREIHRKTNVCDNIVISDLRQEDELERVCKENFIVVKVTANKNKRIERMIRQRDLFKSEDLEHETEKAIDELPFDYLIENNGSLKQLFTQVEDVLEKIKQNG